MKFTKIEIYPTKTVLVIGGRGFIGRHIAEHLESFGCSVIIGSRCKVAPRTLAKRRIVLQELHDIDQCMELIEGVDVVINAVGILRERWNESYEQVHHLAVGHLAQACARSNIRFVHVSALGLENGGKSRFLQSKLKGEKTIMSSTGDWFICRPSIVDGQGGYGAKWFRGLAAWPVHFAPANAKGKLAPIHVQDVGEAIAKLALKTHEASSNTERFIELGGEPMTVFEYLVHLKGNKPLFSISVPTWIARLSSHILDSLHLTPYSFGHYELLKFDNCTKTQHATLLLGKPLRQLGVRGDSYGPKSFYSVVDEGTTDTLPAKPCR